jgi:glycosidase
LAQDFLYKDPTTNVIFLDNHDLARFYSVVNEDMNKYLSSITWLLTCRGIPQWYYTSEFATTGTTYPNDGLVRLDFPGGWEGDKVNKFTAAGRTEKDEMIYQQVARLANFRKSSSALTTGKFMQFAPEDGVYFYFRYDDKQTVMVVMNTSKVEKNIKLARFVERTKGFSQYKNILTKETANLNDFKLGSYKAVAFELLK